MNRKKMKYILCVMMLCNGLWAEDLIKTPKADLTVGLWPDRPLQEGNNDERKYSNIIRITKVERPSLELYKSKSAVDSAPAVVIFPGGGYNILAYNHEGTDVAAWLNSLGYHAVVVKYTVPGNQRMEALKDAQRSICIVRSKAAEWGIDPTKIGVLGFSAGGHLSAHVSTNYKEKAYAEIDGIDKVSCRPDFSVLVYPAYIYDKKGSKTLPKEIKVDKQTPPAFVIQTLDDRNYVASAFNYVRALQEVKVDAELHLFPKGGHGYGLGPFKKVSFDWPKLCAAWLKNVTK
jgi:acetyl esterase/lipase